LSPMQQAVKTESAPHRLTIGELLDWMVEDQLVTAEAAEDLKKERRYYRGALHPLVIIAEQKWRRPGPGGKLLALEPLTEWLAKPVGMEHFHIDPRREQGIVRFRIDGVLHQVYQIPAAILIAMTSRIKILARMDVVEKRRPQDGRVKTRTLAGEEVELRISTMPTAFGEKLVMRIFDPEVLVLDFKELDFSD